MGLIRNFSGEQCSLDWSNEPQHHWEVQGHTVPRKLNKNSLTWTN